MNATIYVKVQSTIKMKLVDVKSSKCTDFNVNHNNKNLKF